MQVTGEPSPSPVRKQVRDVPCFDRPLLTTYQCPREMWLTFIRAKKEWHFFTVTEMFLSPGRRFWCRAETWCPSGRVGVAAFYPHYPPCSIPKPDHKKHHPQNSPFSLIPPAPAHMNSDLQAKRVCQGHFSGSKTSYFLLKTLKIRDFKKSGP